jgi:hypothetical protein
MACSVGPLGGVAADVPQREVHEVEAVLGEPRGDLQALVEVEAVGVAEVLGREADADDEGRGAGGPHGAGDLAQQAGAVDERAAPVVVALVHRPAQELTEEVAVGGVQLDAGEAGGLRSGGRRRRSRACTRSRSAAVAGRGRSKPGGARRSCWRSTAAGR